LNYFFGGKRSKPECRLPVAYFRIISYEINYAPGSSVDIAYETGIIILLKNLTIETRRLHRKKFRVFISGDVLSVNPLFFFVPLW